MRERAHSGRVFRCILYRVSYDLQESAIRKTALFSFAVVTTEGKEMKEVSKEFSTKVVNMSLLCALLVISIHCGYSKSESGICWLVHQMFSGGYSRIGVPFFFVVSGYFLAAHVSEDSWWKRETFKRVKTLLVPFFSWAILYQVLFIPLSLYADYRAGRPFGANVSFLNGNALCVFGLQWDMWPASVPLWYLRALFMFVLVSPVIVFALKKAAKTWIVLLFVSSQLLKYSPDPNLGGWSGFCQHVFNIGGLMYFSIGIYARMKEIHFNSRGAATVGAVMGLILLIAQGVLCYNSVSIKLPLLDFAIPCLMFATWHFMPSTPIPKWLKGTSFPIYIMHSLLLGYWGILAKNVGIEESTAKLVSWPMAFVGCVILANVLRNLAPGCFRFLFGGRD